MQAGAQLSDDRRYRYALWRLWTPRPRPRYAMFVALNPSTADETVDDMTIKKCIGFASRWGYDGIYMLNLYAYRTVDPRIMAMQSDPVGPDNDAAFDYYRTRAGLYVACWGSLDRKYRKRLKWDDRIAEVQAVIGEPLQCLGTTVDGSPRHPSRIAYATEPREWHNPAA